MMKQQHLFDPLQLQFHLCSSASSTTFMFPLPFSSRLFSSCSFSMSSHSSSVSFHSMISNPSSEGVSSTTFFNLHFMPSGGIITSFSFFNETGCVLLGRFEQNCFISSHTSALTLLEPNSSLSHLA